ncbi:MAG: LapA family protein [Betaproteobacteria bacterium]|nr:LapA family protein [Betaproteobacteria bacterium]
MKTRTLFLLAVLISIAAFAALNWSAFNTPTALSVGVASVQAPLGLVMLGLVAFLTALFLVFVVYLQAAVLLDARRHAKDLRANRQLADQAEASRFTELRVFLEAELKNWSLRDEAAQAAMLNRIEQLERDLLAALKRL